MDKPRTVELLITFLFTLLISCFIFLHLSGTPFVSYLILVRFTIVLYKLSMNQKFKKKLIEP